ncbi:hypothetical protein HY227_01245 [Candidatus Wolfebacteria bacterium]|nr:hypothetical protein [Candidatus Wolfebacteria bacterium]
MSIKDIEKKLYGQEPEDKKDSRKSAQKKEPDDKEKRGDLSGWHPMASKKIFRKRKDLDIFSKFSKFSRWGLLASFIVVVGIIAVGSFYIYQYSKGRDVSLTLDTPSNILIGAPFDIEAVFTNESDKPVQDIQIAMFLPENAVSIEDKDKRVLIQNLGDLDPGMDVKTKIPVILYGKTDSVERFKVSASYLPPAVGSATRFEKSQNLDVAVLGEGIKMDLKAPQKVLNNETFRVEINYQNAASSKFDDTKIEMTYPQGFYFKNAVPAPTKGNNIWQFDSLDRGAGGKIIIEGAITSPEKSYFEIRGKVTSEDKLIGEKSASVSITPSPLYLNVSINNEKDYIAHTADALRYRIDYKNNSDSALNDVVIKAQLTGEMYDLATLRAKGEFNSVDNIITWSAANTPALRLLSPGAEGKIEFTIRTRLNYPVYELTDKNFTLKINTEISSPTVPYYVETDRTATRAEIETKVAGKISVKAFAMFNDPQSRIENMGPIPPRMNIPTNYTIHWVVAVNGTQVKNVEVKSILSPNVDFTYKTKSSSQASPTYNSRTKEVKWFINRIPAAKGVLNEPMEAIFQVEATPNISQIDQLINLIEETSVTATDAFTNSNLENSDMEVTSQLLYDSTVRPEQGIVEQ